MFSRALFCLILLTCSRASEDVSEPPIRVLLIGDSITEGIVSGTPARPYAELLSELLGPGFTVKNVGISGITAYLWDPTVPCRRLCGVSDQQSFFDLRIRPELPVDIATILVGTNDAIGLFTDGPPTSSSDYAIHLGRIVQALLEERVGRVVLLTSPISNKLHEPARQRIAEYRDIVLEICRASAGVSCGPDLYRLLDRNSDFQRGDIHPNGVGHARIASALRESLFALSGGVTPASP